MYLGSSTILKARRAIKRIECPYYIYLPYSCLLPCIIFYFTFRYYFLHPILCNAHPQRKGFEPREYLRIQTSRHWFVLKSPGFCCEVTSNGCGLSKIGMVRAFGGDLSSRMDGDRLIDIHYRFFAILHLLIISLV